MQEIKTTSPVPSMPVQPKILRPKEAARYLGIGLSTFWRWVQQGILPQGTRLSARCTVWRIDALDTFLESRGV